MINKEKGDVFTQKVAEYFKNQGVQLTYEYRVDVGLSSKYKKQHAFDLGNSEVLIECKYYDWTESNNNPSAKISTLNEAMLYLLPLYCADTLQKEGVRQANQPKR